MGRASADGAVRSGEQLGHTDEARPEGYLIWVLSETASEAGPAPAICQTLSDRLERPVSCLVTPLDESPLVPTVAEQVIHQYAPADSDGTVHRFLDHWSPDIAIVIGHPARQRLLSETASRDIPLFYAAANRELGTASRRAPAYFNLFDKCLTASASESNALRQQFATIGDRMENTGPLSDTIFAPSCNQAECDELAKLLGGRPVWLAVDVDETEIEIVEAAHRKAFRSAHRLLMILVPRQCADTQAIAERLEDLGWRVARRSAGDEPDIETQVYLADTDGEHGLWYRLAPTCFIGGSLQQGVDPADCYAPAALGSAVLHGPNKGTNPSRISTLETNGACIIVRNAEELGEAVITLLAPDKAASLARAGWTVTTESAHVVERLAELIEETILEREEAG